MEGVTDAPMRELLSERGGFTFFVSEFLRVSQEVPPARTFLEHVPELRSGCLTPSGGGVQLQLLGGDPEKLALTAARACELGARAIDLNFGCPAPTVNRHDGGATLLKHPLRLRAIVEAVRAAVPRQFPVSAKLRLGWDSVDAIDENAERAAEGGASWLTIHGRTRMQGYVPPAYWEPIGRVRRKLGIPVVANGEIWTLDDFRRCRDETGSIHFMIGRGALGDPDLVFKIGRELGLGPKASAGGSGSELSEPRQGGGSASEVEAYRYAEPCAWVALLRRYVSILERHDPGAGERVALARVKQWVRYAKLRHGQEWFDVLKRAQTLEEVFGLLRGSG
jgi:tRNA-dihydrouridine synthase C